MKRIAIIGAGISGLFIANLFNKNSDYQITVYEKNNSINLDEGYGIQLSVNSVKLLNEIGFNEFKNNEKFYPKKINFYSNNSLKKICELDISDYNLENCKYTTLKRSILINFLKTKLENKIKTDHNITKIDQQNQNIKLYFENNEINECDYLIISDGVFSKSKNLISNNQIRPKYNGSLAVRGTLSQIPEYIDNKNISLFFGSNFHHVIYPLNLKGDFNFIAIMKYQLTLEEQKSYSLFNENVFIKKVLNKAPSTVHEILNNLNDMRIFPVFKSDNFFQPENDKIYLIGDAFFAFPPSFAQGASQSLEASYELFKSIKSNTQNNFYKNRVKKIKMVNIRSKINENVFHFSNPLNIFFRNIFLKRLVKNKKFLEFYLGKIYKN